VILNHWGDNVWADGSWNPAVWGTVVTPTIRVVSTQGGTSGVRKGDYRKLLEAQIRAEDAYIVEYIEGFMKWLR